MKFATIVGTGSYVPQLVVTNEAMAELVDTSDEWIVSRTGIKERRISTGENTSDLAFEASKSALLKSGLQASQLDLIICATISPDSFMPSVACIIQERLGAINAAAFDLAAACTGLVYGISVATAFIESGHYTNILVVGAETLSKTLDWSDRSTCVLFGDGAGAVVLTASEQKGISAVHLASDGRKKDYLTLPAVALSNPFMKGESEALHPTISMQGQEVFKFAVRSITELIHKVLDSSNLKQEDIKYIVAHQANSRILEHAAKMLGVPFDKFYVNLERYGNTSAATIGIALDEVFASELLQKGDNVILVGFGGGMTSGAILFQV